MRTVIVFISMACLSLVSNAQDSINLLTSQGYKTGKWITRSPRGKVESIAFYQTTSRPLSRGERFFHDIPNFKDSVVYETTCVWSEQFLYNDSASLSHTVFKHQNRKTEYRFGLKQELAWVPEEYRYFNEVGSDTRDSLLLKNRSTDTLKLRCTYSGSISLASEITIPPQSKIVVPFRLKAQPGNQRCSIQLHNRSIFMNIDLYSFGYHMQGDYLQERYRLPIGETISYYRNSESTFLKVFDSGREKELLSFSLAAEKVNLNISSLTAGQYWFCFFDFKSSEQQWVQIELFEQP